MNTKHTFIFFFCIVILAYIPFLYEYFTTQEPFFLFYVLIYTFATGNFLLAYYKYKEETTKYWSKLLFSGVLIMGFSNLIFSPAPYFLSLGDLGLIILLSILALHKNIKKLITFNVIYILIHVVVRSTDFFNYKIPFFYNTFNNLSISIFMTAVSFILLYKILRHTQIERLNVKFISIFIFSGIFPLIFLYILKNIYLLLIKYFYIPGINHITDSTYILTILAIYCTIMTFHFFLNHFLKPLKNLIHQLSNINFLSPIEDENMELDLVTDNNNNALNKQTLNYIRKLADKEKELENTLKELSESKEKFKYLVDNSNDVFWTMDPDLNIKYVSPKVYDLQGYTPEEILDVPIEKKFTPEAIQIFLNLSRTILSNQGKPEFKNKSISEVYQFPQIHKDGHTIMTEVSLTVNYDENAKAEKAIGITRDISSRIEHQKKIERMNIELKKANDELKTLDDMKTNLLSNVSHELRTPLVSIKGYTSLILSGASGPLTSKQEKQLNSIEKNLSHLITLIESLLSYSRIYLGDISIDMKHFSVIELAEETKDLIITKYNSADILHHKNIHIKIENNLENPFVYADYFQMKQVFINIMDNAVKFSESSVLIIIRLEKDNNEVKISISDNGIGIEKEKLDSIFTRFYQIDNSSTRHYQGLGIGLSIVYKIISLHNSVINVDSEVGKGTTFTFSLTSGKESTLEENKSSISINSNKTEDDKRILIVDDQIEMINFIDDLFEEADIPCDCVTDAKIVMDKMAETNYDVVMLDISMAEIDGLELCRKIKANDPNKKVIMISAFSEKKYKNLAKEAGADYYIVKPFDIHFFIEKVRHFLNN